MRKEFAALGAFGWQVNVRSGFLRRGGGRGIVIKRGVSFALDVELFVGPACHY
jgi:hypothetical protein